MSWLYDILFGWWLPKPKPQPKPKPVPKAATNLRAKARRYNTMTRKVDLKFTWTPSVSTNVATQRFTVKVGESVVTQEDLGKDVFEARVDGFDEDAVVDWSVETINAYGVSATANSQFKVPVFGVEPATDLNVEVVEVHDVE